MRQIIKVALLQLLSLQNNQPENLKKGEWYCRKAKEQGADIVLFPEMWNIGYAPFNEIANTHSLKQLDNIKKWQAAAISQQSPFVKHFQNLAKELEMAIAITYLEKYDPAPRNSVSLIDRHGTILFTYAKVHTCDFSIEAACTPGDEFYVSELDTAHGKVKVGAMICYDREFPESARILMLKGAEIILTPNACDLGENRIGQFKTRAFENMVNVALTNYPAPQNNGHSCAFDAIAFENSETSRNTCIIMADALEGIYMADFEISDLRDWRKCEPWGNAYRKPRTYGLLISEKVEEPFIRTQAKNK